MKKDEQEAIRREYSVLIVAGARIAVRKMPDETQTRSGLFLPKTSSPSIVGQVVGVGPKKEEGFDVEVGDYVLLMLNSGCEVGVGEEPILVVDKIAILAIVKPENFTAKRIQRIIAH